MPPVWRGRERSRSRVARAANAGSAGRPAQPPGQLLVGLQINKRLAPGLVTPEVFERTFGLLADLYTEQ